jgi:hypothetical protein
MFRLLAIAALSLLAVACNKGRALYQDGDVIAAAQAAGYTNVTVIRPQFLCAYDHVGPINTSGSGTFQQGNFFTGMSPQGGKVRAMICHGLTQPSRILELGPDTTGFSPDDKQ